MVDVELDAVFEASPWAEILLSPVVFAFGTYLNDVWLAISLGLAMLFYLASFYLHARGPLTLRNVIRTVVPRSVYLHPSSLTDYGCQFVYPAFVLLLSYGGVNVLSEWEIGAYVTGALASVSVGDLDVSSNLWLTLIVFGVGAMLGDLSQYIMHVLYHRVPFLWEFHKAHHSAEVLTPFTGGRDHPLIFVSDALAYAATIGVYVGVLDWLDPGIMDRIYVWQGGAVMFQIYFLGFLTSHYHLPVGYGVLEHVLVSPAFHMAHHVNHPRYYNRNFGGIFSFWDRLFGTQVAPIEDVAGLEFGIPRHEQTQYDGLVKLHVTPLVRLLRLPGQKLGS